MVKASDSVLSDSVRSSSGTRNAHIFGGQRRDGVQLGLFFVYVEPVAAGNGEQ